MGPELGPGIGPGSGGDSAGKSREIRRLRLARGGPPHPPLHPPAGFDPLRKNNSRPQLRCISKSRSLMQLRSARPQPFLHSSALPSIAASFRPQATYIPCVFAAISLLVGSFRKIVVFVGGVAVLVCGFVVGMGGGPVSPGRRDEIVLITGCSEGGIGAALAVEFCDNGFTVVATSRSVSTMKLFERHQHIEVLALDLLSEESIQEAVETVISMFGRIDILVNNAGMPCTAPLAEIPIGVVDKVYRTNFLGPIMLIQAVVPHMVAKGKGKIVNVGSISCFATGPFTGAYASSKSALQSATDALRLELKPFNIDVMMLVPGGVVTGLASKSAGLLKDNLSALKIYKPYEEYLLKRAMLSHHPKSTPATLFARKAVGVIIAKGPTPAAFTFGFLSRIYRFLYFCPYWIRDWWFSSKLPTVTTVKKQS